MMKVHILFIALACGLARCEETTLKGTTDPPTPPPTTPTPEPTKPKPPTTMPTTHHVTTTPKPEDYKYNVTSDKIVCIMMSGDLSFNVVYATGINTTKDVKVMLPKPSTAVNTTGICAKDHQEMSITWVDEEQEHEIDFKFELSNDKKFWFVDHVVATIPLVDQFVNATDYGKILVINMTLTMDPHNVPVNQSFSCLKMTAGNYTAKLDNQEYDYHITADFDTVQLQAFNQIANTKNDFVTEIHCDADKTSDIVPIAVGCALGGLVVVVLIAYIFGRKRRSAAYQSV